MRYHWGQGIGHRYAFTSTAASNNDSIHKEAEEVDNDQCSDLEPDSDEVPPGVEGASDTDESENSEPGLDDRDLEGWEDVETSDSGNDSDSPSEERDSEDED